MDAGRTYLKPSKQWQTALEAILRLSARLGRPFTYGELGDEIKSHDGLSIDGRMYPAVLNAVARHTPRDQPLWTVMAVNQDTGRPSDGFWKADYLDASYKEIAKLSVGRIDSWLALQQSWCVALARVTLDPLDQGLRDIETDARTQANDSLMDLRLEQHHDNG